MSFRGMGFFLHRAPLGIRPGGVHQVRHEHDPLEDGGVLVVHPPAGGKVPQAALRGSADAPEGHAEEWAGHPRKRGISGAYPAVVLGDRLEAASRAGAHAFSIFESPDTLTAAPAVRRGDRPSDLVDPKLDPPGQFFRSASLMPQDAR